MTDNIPDWSIPEHKTFRPYELDASKVVKGCEVVVDCAKLNGADQHDPVLNAFESTYSGDICLCYRHIPGEAIVRSYGEKELASTCTDIWKELRLLASHVTGSSPANAGPSSGT